MSSLATDDRPEAPLFSDGLGERVVAADGATGELLQILRLRPTLTAVPSFEFALRERTARLANFRHAYYVRVRRVDRAMAPTSALAIVSDHLEGTRLSDILRVAEDKRLQIDINAALCLIRQLVPAVAVLHENARDVAHGLIAPERLIVTPNARLVIVEHVLGAAIEQLQFGRDRLWQEFRVAMPPSAGLPRFDHRADVTGMGLVALALILGRPLDADEYPHRIPDLLNEARERSALGDEQPLSPPLRTLAGARAADRRAAFVRVRARGDGRAREVVSDDGMYVAAPVALETFLSRYIASLLEPPTPEPVARVEPPAPVVNPIDDLSAALDAALATPRPIAATRHGSEGFSRGIRVLLRGRTSDRRRLQLPPLETSRSCSVLDRRFRMWSGLRLNENRCSIRTRHSPRCRWRRPRPPDRPRSATRYVRARGHRAPARRRRGAGLQAVPPARCGADMGALVVQSNPPGIPVFVDGIEQGRRRRG